MEKCRAERKEAVGTAQTLPQYCQFRPYLEGYLESSVRCSDVLMSYSTISLGTTHFLTTLGRPPVHRELLPSPAVTLHQVSIATTYRPTKLGGCSEWLRKWRVMQLNARGEHLPYIFIGPNVPYLYWRFNRAEIRRGKGGRSSYFKST